MVYKPKYPQKLKGVGDVIRSSGALLTHYMQQYRMVICLLGCHCHCSPDSKQSCKHKDQKMQNKEKDRKKPHDSSVLCSDSLPFSLAKDEDPQPVNLWTTSKYS